MELVSYFLFLQEQIIDIIIIFWQQAISLPLQSVVVGEVGQCVGMRWQEVGGVGVLQTGPVAAGVRVYSSRCITGLQSRTASLRAQDRHVFTGSTGTATLTPA